MFAPGYQDCCLSVLAEIPAPCWSIVRVSVAPDLCHTSQQTGFSYGDYISMLVQLIMFHVVDAIKALPLYAMKAQGR
jgi:hypothetical protein